MDSVLDWFKTIDNSVLLVLTGIFCVLTLTSIFFRIPSLFKKKDLQEELIVRNNSWWYIALGVVIITIFPFGYGSILMVIVSFAALREMFSISPLRASDRLALFWGYLSIPVQYYLAYKNLLIPFLIFIPLGMFVLIPVTLTVSKRMARVGTSMTMIPSLLILSVYMPSHLILLHHATFNGVHYGGSLILFLIILTAFNDVFQFTWGKLLGKHKILPVVSPNKTMEGFIGGIFTTAGLSCVIRFLTPFSVLESLLIGLMIGIFGFFGDAIISAIKRDLRIKDTGKVIPGHGGVMDRLDSLLFTSPFFFHIVYQLSLNAQ